MLESDYVLVINGRPEGPFNIEQLKKLNIKPDDFVKTGEMPDYKEAHEIAELREIFHFAKQSIPPQYFAGFDQRLMASVLDWFFIAGFYCIAAFVAIIFIEDKAIRMGIAFSLLLFIPITKLIYHIIMECSFKRATYGKQIVNIKVSDLNGERINLGTSIARNLCKVFSLLSIVGYLYSFFNKKQQCLHDVMCNTLVIKDRLF